MTMARAIATRCSWPPESCRGIVVLAARRGPTILSAVITFSRRLRRERCVSSSGSSTFSNAVRTGIRL